MSDIASTVVATETPAQPDSISSFSFDSLHDKALSMLEGGNTPADVPAEQVAPDAPADATNVDNASQAQLAQLSDDQLVEVTVDGQPVQMPWSEAKGGVMRQAKFTKEMQTLRSQQQAFETERQSLTAAQQERNALVELLNNEELLAKLIVQKYPHWVQQQAAAAAAGQDPAQDPDDIVTRGQVQNITQGAVQSLQQLVNQVKADLEQKVASVTETIEDRQQVAKLSAEINTTIKGLFAEHPYISKVVPEAEQMLRYQVSKMAPSTPEETVEAFKTVFGGWVENYKAEVANTTKQSVITKQKLVDNNIQPRGGSEVTPQPLQTWKTNPMTGKKDLDWAALRQAALNRLGE